MVSLRLGSDGRLLSAFRFGGEYESYSTSIGVAPQAMTVIAGGVMVDSSVFGGPVRTMKVIGHDRNGRIEWQRGTVAAYPRTAEQLVVRPDGSVMTVGWWFEFSMNAGLLVRIDPEGRFPTDPLSIDLRSESFEMKAKPVSSETGPSGLLFRPADGAFAPVVLESRLQWP